MNMTHELLQTATRRQFLGQSGLSLGSIALASMMGGSASSAATRTGHLAGKIKNVIYLYMAGSPSQLDLFDHKPMLAKHHGEPCPKELLEGKRFAFIRGTPSMLRSPFKFHRHGESGVELSELLPHIGSVADDVTFLKGLHTEQFNHSPAQLMLLTGSPRLGSASLGSWVTYGLGSENQNLPGFIVLVSSGKKPSAGASLWGSGFLPSVYQGVQCRTKGDPVLYLSDPKGMNREGRRATLDALKELNELQAAQLGDPEIRTRIAQYELSYRMQLEVPDVMDISKEPKHILDLYGAVPGHHSTLDQANDPRVLYKGTDPTFSNNCLLARRLVERGVRFVQMFDWGWDHHGSSPGESIDETLPIKAQQIDRAIAGLITDLKQRGLFDETLVIWGGEFGRTPMMQNNKFKEPKKGHWGRDHHPYAYTMFMASGALKGGMVHGQTDELGYYIDEGAVSIPDLQATVLHLLGLDPYKFSFPYQGLNQRLIGPTDEADIVTPILA